ncbi:class I SAM-dependent methyltransferase [Actinospica sp. MGRD01-02]|uniref:Class I SAM-dependent methyltransferase n=1 Tax=Actinospica acidithermotolerans TaxID=2828514 RepID=A0A941IHK4_9ACTN|nr:class I SAM-dependent methyltransferase [Actinospica acidithermotolerans]MBR7825807.1 class I SAM-dependent methyltransferase [Actinospica acidithermotolerans]
MTTTQGFNLTWPLATPPTGPEHVWAASYPDFVAMINQTNVMPGAFATINDWALHARMSANSTLLDVACTTGFTSRELARITGCRALGFDLSANAIALARYNHLQSGRATDVEYVQADGMDFAPGRSFSHIAVGAALGFFPDPPGMARRLVDLLEDGGHILAAPFWCDYELPEEVQTLRRDIFGITSPMETRADALDLFRGLDVIYQADHTLTPETDEQVAHYCYSTIERVCHDAEIRDPRVKEAMTERLKSVKNATNRLRAHQRYSVFVLRYDATTYPHRYVELF